MVHRCLARTAFLGIYYFRPWPGSRPLTFLPLAISGDPFARFGDAQRKLDAFVRCNQHAEECSEPRIQLDGVL